MKYFLISSFFLFYSLSLFSKQEISIGGGGLSYGISFKDNFNDYNSYRITGLGYLYSDSDSPWDKFVDLSIQYNYSIKSKSSESLYMLVAASFLYSIIYSGSITDYKKNRYYKGALGLGINEIFSSWLSLTLEFHQIIHFNNSVSHVDSTHVTKDIYTYPSISLYLGIIF